MSAARQASGTPLTSSSVPRKILVICRPILGDMILAGPVFRNLRAWSPGATITAVCYEGKRDFLTFTPEVDEVIEIPRRRQGGRAAFAARWLSIVRRLRSGGFDLVYDIMQTDRSSLLCLLTGAPVRTGFVKGERRLRHGVYTHTAPWVDGDLEPAHAVDLYLRPLEEVGMPVRTRSTEIALDPADVAEARARLRAIHAGADRPWVACHPGASSANKCWPLENFAAVCDELQAEQGARVLLMGGPAEAESLRSLRAMMSTAPAVIEETLPLRQLAGVLGEVDLLFCHDSGPMHVAASVGTPVVALFGASSPAQWRPLGGGHTVVRPSMPCVPCAYPSLCNPPSPYKMFCVRRLGLDEVRLAVRRALEAWRGARERGSPGGA